MAYQSKADNKVLFLFPTPGSGLNILLEGQDILISVPSTSTTQAQSAKPLFGNLCTSVSSSLCLMEFNSYFKVIESVMVFLLRTFVKKLCWILKMHDRKLIVRIFRVKKMKVDQVR